MSKYMALAAVLFSSSPCVVTYAELPQISVETACMGTSAVSSVMCLTAVCYLLLQGKRKPAPNVAITTPDTSAFDKFDAKLASLEEKVGGLQPAKSLSLFGIACTPMVFFLTDMIIRYSGSQESQRHFGVENVDFQYCQCLAFSFMSSMCPIVAAYMAGLI